MDGKAGRWFLSPKLSTGYYELSTACPHLYPQQPVATGVAFEQRIFSELSTGYPQVIHNAPVTTGVATIQH
jgi:hypothetical protein